MDQWEYLPTYLEANASKKEVKQFLKNRLDVKRPSRYMPEAMMPQLNELGAQGWELVHMEPVARVGKKGDVLFANIGRHWSNVYFCVFKRMRQAKPKRPDQNAEVAAPVASPLPPDSVND